MRLIAILFCLFMVSAAPCLAQTVGQPMPDAKGMTLEIEGRVRLNISLVERRMQLVFMDTAGKVIESPFRRVIVHVDRSGTDSGAMHLLFRPVLGNPVLRHERVIPPPDRYRLRIVLYPLADDDRGMFALPVQTFVWSE